MYYDYTFLFLIPGLLIALFAQIKLSATYAKYQKIESEKGMTGHDTARMILDTTGFPTCRYCARAREAQRFYNPANRTVSLSPDVYSSSSLASIGIAAHECSHPSSTRKATRRCASGRPYCRS
jgi:Zn-dependent membrane protease YugP